MGSKGGFPAWGWAAAAGGAAVVLLAAAVVWWGRPPQMGADEEAFRAVDALFTAVTARDERLLGQCERQLRTCRDEGKLPAEAASHLDGVIATARQGGWEAAAERLYRFMTAQRRDGAQEHPSAARKDRPAKAQRK